MRVSNSAILFVTRLWATIAAITANVMLSFLGCRSVREVPESASTRPADKGDITITVVYDNNPGREGLIPAWGFACIVQGLEKTILFDTGGDGRILLANMRGLGIDPKKIDVVVISHIHGDHTGGLEAFLRTRRDVPVFIPTGFPTSFKEQIRSRRGRPIEADETLEMCSGVRTTGTFGKGDIEEHGLCVNTPAGWVLITGCAHPGAANMAAKAKELTAGPIELVVGGFHMGRYSKKKIKGVIDHFEQLGIRHVAPCHCSGNTARSLFKERYGKRCTLAGVGTVFRFGPD